MASTYLSRTTSSATLATKYTLSFWVKRSKPGADHRIFNNYVDSNNSGQVYFDASNDYLNLYDVQSGSSALQLITNRKFRDPNAFMHIVIAVDTTQTTASDRAKIYINGTQETSFSTSNYPSQDSSLSMQGVSASGQRRIGSHNGGGDYFDGCLAHLNYVDGSALAPTVFGETDSTSGIWKPKPSPSGVTYGNNGEFLKFENSGAMGTDSSGNSNTYTVNGTLTQNVDTPSNNFATLNPLSQTGNFTLSGSELPTNGNTVFTGKSSNNYPGFFSTLAASTGKYYAEFKVTSAAQGDSMIGVSNGLWNNVALGGSAGSYGSQDYVYFGYNGNIYTSGSGSAYGSAISLNDIVQIALDCDNNAMYVGVNDVYQNSGVPTSGASKTGAVNLPTSTTGVWHFAVGDYGGDGVPVINCNFGSGFFGTTAVTSANSDANGHGEFEYEVPTGYYALCTKNIKEFG